MTTTKEPVSDRAIQEIARVMNRYLEGSIMASEACMIIFIGLDKHFAEILPEFDAIEDNAS